MSEPLANKAQEYRAELKDVQERLKIVPANWWDVYPRIVRCNYLATQLKLKPPFNRDQVKLAKEQLCQSRSSPPNPMP
jgi:hypothetical protein